MLICPPLHLVIAPFIIVAAIHLILPQSTISIFFFFFFFAAMPRTALQPLFRRALLCSSSEAAAALYREVSPQIM